MPDMVLVPDYYEQFECLGGQCKYTCCHGWTINLTKQDYTKIRATKKSPALEERLKTALKRYKKNVTDSDYAQIIHDTKTKLCPMVNENGLCALQVECGYTVLPAICKNFPRIRHEVPILIKSCSTGCERVVELLMEYPNGLHFHQIPREEHEFSPHWVAYSELDIEKKPILKHFTGIQDLCIGILQNRLYSLDDRMIMLGIALKGLNELEQAEKINAIPEFLRQKQILKGDAGLKESLAKIAVNPDLCLCNNIKNSLYFINNSGDRSRSLYQEIFQSLNVYLIEDELNYNMEKYKAAAASFAAQGWGALLENLMVNVFVTSYLPFIENTIWDSYIFLSYFYSLLKFMAAGYMTPEKTKEDMVQLVTVFSRSILHQRTRESLMELNRNESNTLAHMAIMIKG